MKYKMLKIDVDAHAIISRIASQERRSIKNMVEQMAINYSPEIPHVDHIRFKISQLAHKDQKDIKEWLCMKTESDT